MASAPTDAPVARFPGADGLPLAYREVGPADGRPLILIHGTGGHAYEPVRRLYQNDDGQSYAQTFADLWHRYDVLRGMPVALLEGGRRHAGIVAGLDDDGALLVRTQHGRLERIIGGDVILEK